MIADGYRCCTTDWALPVGHYRLATIGGALQMHQTVYLPLAYHHVNVIGCIVIQSSYYLLN